MHAYIFLGLASLSFFAPQDDIRVTTRSTVTVQSPLTGESIQGLLFFQERSLTLMDRAFLEGRPGEARVILESSIDARSGRSRWKIRDDASDWSFEVTRDSGVKTDNITEFLKRATTELTADRVKNWTAKIRSSSGGVAEMEVPTLGGVGCRDAADQIGEFKRELWVPQSAEFVRLVQLLGRSIESNPSGLPQFGCTVEMFTGLLKRAGVRDLQAVPRLAVGEKPSAVGPKPDPEDLRTLSRFRSLPDPGEPMGRSTD